MHSLRKFSQRIPRMKQARFWAQIGVKLTHFETMGVFFKNWAPPHFFKQNGVMLSMQSFRKILMVDPVKSCLQIQYNTLCIFKIISFIYLVFKLTYKVF